MDDIANALGTFFLNLLVSIGVIPYISDEFVTPLGYFIIAILIIIILFSMRKFLSRSN